MKFSIVVASYKSEDRISALLDSLAVQTCKDFELIVQESGRSSSIAGIIKKYRAVLHVSHEVGIDTGIYDAWNKAIKRVTGQWVLFLGDDDQLAGSRVLETVSNHLDNTPDHVDIAYGRVERVNESGASTVIGEEWAVARSALHRCNPIPHQGVFHRRSVFLSKSFDENYKICADYVFLFPILSLREPMYIDMVVSKMSHGGISTSMRSQVMVGKELTSAYVELGISESFLSRARRLLAARCKVMVCMILGERVSASFFYSVKALTGSRVR